MGVPAWAKQHNSSPDTQPITSKNRFPIHRLEDSPVIAAYTHQTARPRSRSAIPTTACPPGSRSSTATPATACPPGSRSPARPSTPARPLTPVSPGEIVRQVKKEYVSLDQQVVCQSGQKAVTHFWICSQDNHYTTLDQKAFTHLCISPFLVLNFDNPPNKRIAN
eukprot:TRINITY_DN59974_c0_g1_i1.p1 TRINITY_DN59974_c0_g1~~TRINITY_DN59974_c0_g1_i1.p1  ORF type:complete len:172 (+),score=43.53 TRINITY_DN59974_c0_g1_i1:23-517(+)